MDRQVVVNSFVYEVYIPTDVSGTIKYPGLTPSDFSGFSVLNGLYSALTIMDGSGVSNNSLSPGVIYIEEAQSGTGVYNVRFYPVNIGYYFVSLTFVDQDTITDFRYSIIPNTYSYSDGVVVD